MNYQKQKQTNCLRQLYFLAKGSLCLMSYLIIFVLVLLGLIVLIVPIEDSKSKLIEIDSLEEFEFKLKVRTSYTIIDSQDCASSPNGVCVNLVCSQSITHDNPVYCSAQMKISRPINFKKLIINSSQNDDFCDVAFKSQHLSADQLFLFGYKVYVRGEQIKVNELFFDTYVGYFAVNNISFKKAYLNSNIGDIVVQTKNNVKFSTLSKEPYICVTSNSSYKDTNNKISDVSEIMVQKDKKAGECQKTYSFYQRDFNKMVREGKFSAFEQQSSPEYASKDEDRCYQIDNAFLLNDVSKDPSSASEISELFISNGEGNIHVNILNKDGLISNLVQNDIYTSKELSMINQQLENIRLADKIQSIQDSGKLNEVLFIDFGQNRGEQNEFIYIIGFNQLFFHLSPVWVHSLSLGTLGSELEFYQVQLSPGFCPYVFKFSDLGGEEIQQRVINQRHQQIQQTLTNFFEQQNVTAIQFQSIFNEFQKVDPSDPGSYKYLHKPDVAKGVRIVSISKIGYIFIFIAILYVVIYKVITTLADSINNKFDVDRVKIYFYFYQWSEKSDKHLNNEYQPNNDQLYQPKQEKYTKIYAIDQSKVSSEEKFLEKQEKQGNEEKQSFSDIKYICTFQTKNPLIHYSFQSLCTEGFAWLQQRQLSSLTMFYKELFIKKPESELNIDSQVKIFKISIQDLKKMYLQFCYYFDLEIESLFNEKGISALPRDFSLVYDQTIVFKKPNNFENSKDEFLVDLDEEDQQLISYIIKEKKLQNSPEEMSLSKFYYNCDCRSEDIQTGRLLNEEFYIKSNKKLVIALQPNSEKIINEEFMNNFGDIFTDYLTVSDSQKDPSKTLSKGNNDAQSNLNEINQNLNDSYFYFQFSTKESLTVFQNIGLILRSVVLQVIYLVSPFIFCALSLIFMIIYDQTQLKLDSYNKDSLFENKGLLLKLITFDIPILSLLALAIIIFIISFYVQLMLRNTFSFTELAKNSQIGYILEYNRQIYENFKKNNNQKKSIFMYIILLISLILLLVQITYVCGAFILLAISSVVFSKLQIPVVIFFGVLIGTIIQTITTFTNQKRQGEKTLKGKFVANLRSAFEKLQISNQENEEQLKKIINSKDDKVNKRFYQSDLKHYASDYQDMFSFITQNKSSQIDEYQFGAFLQGIRMELNKVQLNQLYAQVKYDKQKGEYAKQKGQQIKQKVKQVQQKGEYDQQTVEQNKQKRGYDKQKGEQWYTIRLWKLNKNLNLMEFNKAIEFMINQKIIQALNILDISYASLYLSLVGTILKSILIAFLIYSIFTGLTDSEQEFDFAQNSFVSIGGVLGIFISKEDKGSLLSDEQVMNQTTEDIEKQTHEYN